MSDPSIPLKSVKQERFAQEYATGISQAEAYRRSYDVSPNSDPESSRRKAWDLMQNVTISARVEYLKSQVASQVIQKVGITKEWVVQRLIDVHNMAITGEPILGANGENRGTKQNLPAANKALELIGTELGMFNKNVTISGDKENPLLLLAQHIQGSALPIVKQVEDAVVEAAIEVTEAEEDERRD